MYRILFLYSRIVVNIFPISIFIKLLLSFTNFIIRVVFYFY